MTKEQKLYELSKELVYQMTGNYTEDTQNGDFQIAWTYLNKAMDFIPCCTELKADKKKLNFKDWKYSKGLRYLSGHSYKDNDGDLYDSDEIEKMYQHYISL